MGICSSCLGNRRRDEFEDDDEAQHLFDDPNNLHYGSFDQQHMMSQEDPQEAQREIEALQRVVARTSDAMVDIYEIVPQDKAAEPAPGPYVYAGQDATTIRYQTLLSKLSSHDDLAAVACVDWGFPDDDTIEMQQGTVPIKVDGGDTLIGNFADAAAAMR
ncbi:hypothetical protein N657DRAFT_561388 [Parathielavia appendiculata]|uniref:Late endosomal/lysosomal adaptor and MAPK and MTOR activator-domain-containing protein n=1 Tax=Parathielavia appendiculata TaxID=2587402 RepID=A0AAN6U7Y3_9PEZI|nr:hypothetical protein N657DRAFT_561388 [Parathielavia appendiculata]